MLKSYILYLFVLVVLALWGCVTPESRVLTTYNGISQGSDGRVWMTGNTTVYQALGTQLAVVSSNNWVQVCTEGKSGTSTLDCNVVTVRVRDGRLPYTPKNSTKPSPDQDDGGRDDEDDDDASEGDEDEDEAPKPKAKGHPLRPEADDAENR